jgi:hypothetical protein
LAENKGGLAVLEKLVENEKVKPQYYQQQN